MCGIAGWDVTIFADWRKLADGADFATNTPFFNWGLIRKKIW
jgi:hypothetical protein